MCRLSVASGLGSTTHVAAPAVNRAAGPKHIEAMRAELKSRGIPRNVTNITSFGEGQPPVPTEDGVREVQNQRIVARV